MEPVAEDGTQLSRKGVRFFGWIAADVQAEPAEIVFGPRPVGETCEESVFLSSKTGRPFRVENVTGEGDGVTVEGGADMTTFRVRRRVARTGESRSIVKFTVRIGEEVTVLSLPVITTGFVAEVR